MSIGLLGCLDTTAPPEATETEAPLSTCVQPAINNNSLVITQAEVLAKFDFTRTLNTIVAGVPVPVTAKNLFQQWMSTYGASDCTNPLVDPQHYGFTCPRSPEASLANVDPTDPNSPVKFLPVGIFNRFDLAPADGSNCGEYRIVYAMHATGTGTPPIFGRGFLIFEGALRNPFPSQHLAGCKTVAAWWAARSRDSVTDLATNMEKFFYLGTAIPGVQALVDPESYGMGTNHQIYLAGQIRANMFVNDHAWNLREFKTDFGFDATGLHFTIDHVTTKNVPAPSLFQHVGPHAPAFESNFPLQITSLASDDVSTIGMSTGDVFNIYDNQSSPNLFDYDTLAAGTGGGTITAAVTAKLASLGITDITPAQIFRRAETQTCAGCHQASTFGTESQLGRGLVWPRSLGFTQIDEQGDLSEALRNNFLPHRKQVLAEYLCDVRQGSPGHTIGGSVVGAAN